MIQLALQLDQLVQDGTTIYLKLEPEIVDFTRSEFCYDIVLNSKSNEVVVEINSENAMEMFALLKAALFEDKKISIIGWNLKNLFTCALAQTNNELEYECKLLDLKLAECFIGIRERSPTTFADMVKRLKRLFADSSWSKFKTISQKVYVPLLTRVIPKIEVEGIFDSEKRQVLFPYYEIEGQTGGRLSTQMAYDNCFNPHSLSSEEKSKIYPKGHELVFLSFDYHFHEVCMLAWLSQDEKLLGLVSEEGDFYSKLYDQITDDEVDDKRSFCKDFLFLPVIYGQSAKTLAERANIGIEVAEGLIWRLRDIFPDLFNWIETYSSVDGAYADYIGRKRYFLEGNEYKYRNFIIQSPGAIFCLEKLVLLHNELGAYGRIVAHIHDGFVVCCIEKQVEMVQSICLKALEKESDLFSGLKISANCKISNTLA